MAGLAEFQSLHIGNLARPDIEHGQESPNQQPHIMAMVVSVTIGVAITITLLSTTSIEIRDQV